VVLRFFQRRDLDRRRLGAPIPLRHASLFVLVFFFLFFFFPVFRLDFVFSRFRIPGRTFCLLTPSDRFFPPLQNLGRTPNGTDRHWYLRPLPSLFSVHPFPQHSATLGRLRGGKRVKIDPLLLPESVSWSPQSPPPFRSFWYPQFWQGDRRVGPSKSFFRRHQHPSVFPGEALGSGVLFVQAGPVFPFFTSFFSGQGPPFPNATLESLGGVRRRGLPSILLLVDPPGG